MSLKTFKSHGMAREASQILFFCLFACAGTLSAGGEVGEIFNFGAGARALGMGGAYSAVTNDSTSLYYNPAGLSMLRARNVNMMRASLYEGASYNYLSYASNFSKIPAAYGFQLIMLNSGPVEGRDSNNMPTSAVSYSETAFSVGSGYRGLFLPFLSSGASVKLLMRNMDKYSDKMLSMDMGLSYGPFYGDKLNISFVMNNVTSLTFGDTSDKYPLDYKAGVSYRLADNFLLAFDMKNFSRFSIGTEYIVAPGFLRLGYNEYGFSYGTGVKFLKSYQFDLAMSKNADLGMSTRFSLGYFFGGQKETPKIAKFSPDYLSAADKAFGESDYLSALENIQLAISVNSQLMKTDWNEKSKRLEKFIKDINLKNSKQKQDSLKERTEKFIYANTSITEYVAGNYMKSMIFAHIALGHDPDNALLRESANALSRLTDIPIKEDEILDREGYVKNKLKRSEMYFYAQKFEKVIKECEELLMLEPNNVLGLTRLGSAYFMMGNREKAKELYTKALKLYPNNKAVADFIKAQNW